ncbi:MAG TPA: FTR1 family protein, partial [Vicinamibacterales bacterium]|nr:FTR1 family protein [Vicinamibacterales bacterium]
MLQAFVITLREGLEAFLIVAISLAYLRKSGRSELIKAVNSGIVVAVAVSAIGGYLLFNAANQEWLEGPLALIAAVSVLTLT